MIGIDVGVVPTRLYIRDFVPRRKLCKQACVFVGYAYSVRFGYTRVGMYTLLDLVMLG